MKDFNIFSIVSSLLGGIITYMLGGFDMLLKALLTLIILDCITGIIKGIYIKTLSSQTGFKGVLKKILILVIVALSVVVQQMMNDTVPIRETVIVFFICNEGISILENAAQFIPVPDKLRGILLQLRKEGD
ncbi:MAG: phage holin family protein [Eubacterium sp.]|nr:phage holin family protein [Eubacterium sp.]MBR4241163.1 phage holin family protein [Eubacterium sp.]